LTGFRRGVWREDSLIVPFVAHDDAAEAALLGVGNPFYTVEYDFVLVRA